ncbi:hypothetical protein G6F62_009920 [Rhizopus arrhizus]|nr:hypothetical protein G6F62_009920 [Rhizopus arrhizus]
MKLVKEIVTKYLIIDADSDVALVSAQYEKALNVFKNHKDTQKAEEAIRRLPAIDALMKSSHIMNEFRSQITSDIQAAAVVAMKSNVVEQTHREITGQQMRPHQQQMKQQQSASSAQPQQQDTKRQCEPYTLRDRKKMKKATESTSNEDSQQPSQKSTSALLRDMRLEEALKYIMNNSSCKNNVVDFTKPIPRTFRKAVPGIVTHYKFYLESAITLLERRILVDLSLCKDENEQEKLLNILFTQTNSMTENIKYLRVAINGLFDLWRSKRLNDSNNEGWLRSNFYSFIWDRAFLFDETFFVKRAECYSAVIKKLQGQNEDIAQQRVDFILRSNHDGSDYLTSEEKPRDEEASYDINKGKKMQQHMLKLWSNWLGSRELVGELEAMTCQWQKTKLTVFGTRMLPSGKFIFYKKATAVISPTAIYYAAAARLLQIVLSVKHLVTLNHMKLMAMVQAIDEYSNENLDLTISTDQPYITYYSSSQDSSGSEEENTPEYVQKALSASKSVKHPDDIVSAGVWEKMIIEDVNKALLQEKRSLNMQ